jgi:hypothetical protein
MGPQAAGENERLLGGQVITLIQDVTQADQDGVLPRYVVSEGAFINYELIRNGFAKAYLPPPDLACQNSFLTAEIEARNKAQGLWAPTPIPTDTPRPSLTLTPFGGASTITPTTKPVCKCSDDLTCNNFNKQSKAQACFDYCRQQGDDLERLDKNNNGLACEGMD